MRTLILKYYHLLEVQIEQYKQARDVPSISALLCIYLCTVCLSVHCVFICALCICSGNASIVLGAGKQRWINTASGPQEFNAGMRIRPKNKAGYSQRSYSEQCTTEGQKHLPNPLAWGGGTKGRRNPVLNEMPSGVLTPDYKISTPEFTFILHILQILCSQIISSPNVPNDLLRLYPRLPSPIQRKPHSVRHKFQSRLQVLKLPGDNFPPPCVKTGQSQGLSVVFDWRISEYF